jgi:N-acetylglucosaminyl-diphospho-decaprenol L-rhamnosyltransferase
LRVDLSIIIVNWNAGKLLRRSVESVIASRPSVDYELLVIDNASADESLTVLRASDLARELINRGRLRIIENGENLGFGQANNQAFTLTTAPFLLLLNPDTEVTAGSIDCLVATVQSNPRIAAAGPRVLNDDGSLQISVWRNPPAAWEILLSQMKLYLLLPRRLRGELLLGGHWDHNRERRVPMLSGAAMLVRRTVIEEVGGFDERFHMYGEDNEWCLRIMRAGWQLIFQPSAVIFHHGAQSSLQRWNKLEKLRVQLKASYFFQQHSLPRRRLISNQLACYVTASGQDLWRRIRGIHAPDVKLAREIHWEHLKRAFLSSTNLDQGVKHPDVAKSDSDKRAIPSASRSEKNS